MNEGPYPAASGRDRRWASSRVQGRLPARQVGGTGLAGWGLAGRAEGEPGFWSQGLAGAEGSAGAGPALGVGSESEEL